jgi:hypothetical protein
MRKGHRLRHESMLHRLAIVSGLLLHTWRSNTCSSHSTYHSYSHKCNCTNKSTSPTSAPTNQSSAGPAQATLPPTCGNLVQNADCRNITKEPNGCPCNVSADCYANEICCIVIGPPIATKCYEVTPAPTTAGPTTTQDPKKQCPSTISNPVCIPGLVTTSTDGATCSATVKCRSTEVCCTPYRGMPSCCVALPS